ncbi:hypothetical protein B0H63DRAFT_533430 [Podospora didyma]|uniref:Insecticide toxin TcdB middle/N-terminal domain-containing protein n=1 Tax=Podospora didyma TaxID=330526 RepID=A0AAE0U8S4_9PEZI|nr:hypothetical protein B0H63DRAFT_533430 [Podospora didyma]
MKYSYHDGYFDPYEREFCGFGMVETSQRELLHLAPVAEPSTTTTVPCRPYKTPMHYTKRWYHSGAAGARLVPSDNFGEVRIKTSLLGDGGWSMPANIRRKAFRALRDPATPSWSQNYKYQSSSLLKPSRTGNRLTATELPGKSSTPYFYDKSGNMTAMPGFAHLEWDAFGRLRSVSRQVVNEGKQQQSRAAPETTLFVYDMDDVRVRNVTDAFSSSRKMKETLYLVSTVEQHSTSGGMYHCARGTTCRGWTSGPRQTPSTRQTAQTSMRTAATTP